MVTWSSSVNTEAIDTWFLDDLSITTSSGETIEVSDDLVSDEAEVLESAE